MRIRFLGVGRAAAALVTLALLGLGAWALVKPNGDGADPGGPPIESREVLRDAVRGSNIVICVIDAARADHAGCYGYPRPTTPAIDRLASQGLLFEKHFCQFVETKPSTASLFTSQHADTHLAREERCLQEGTFTLAQGFKAAGFHTVLFSQNEYASPLWCLGRHFDEKYYEPHLKSAGWNHPFVWLPEALLEQVEPWLGKRPPEPFFMYVHFMPPHSPYIAPPEIYSTFMDSDPPDAWRAPYPFDEIEVELRSREKPWDEVMFVNRYDGHYLFADMAIGELERLLREAGVWEDTLFIATSDHGEAFGEHGYKGHTICPYDECTHVPLAMKFPGKKGPIGRVSGLTQTIDLLPTLFELYDVPLPDSGIQGHSLVPLILGDVEEVNDFIFSRTAGDPPSYAVRDHDWLLILYEGGRLKALYDLREDPRALENVYDEKPEKAAELIDVFSAFAQRQAAPPMQFADPAAPAPQWPEVEKIEPTEEMLDTLRTLGYLR